MIELRNIDKTYQMGDNVVRALQNVSLTVGDREFAAIIGPSGSGKSTMMNIIGCLDQADCGEYLLDGEEVTRLSERRLSLIRSRRIGFVFQQFNLLQKLTAYENVELPLIYQGLPHAERKMRVREALAEVGLADRMRHRPNELSGGQQQRVAIARALVTRPSLILADEPTGNLDSRSGAEIMALLSRVHQSGNCVIVITHDQSIANLADRRIRLSDGMVIADDGRDLAITDEDLKAAGATKTNDGREVQG
ncbi:MAG: ABC transporter ATP-binding protein [Ruminococcaceae bacterium]|nr:ABC transporter ATP-binding protein [Oscillospiraceae bacterium]